MLFLVTIAAHSASRPSSLGKRVGLFFSALDLDLDLDLDEILETVAVDGVLIHF